MVDESTSWEEAYSAGVDAVGACDLESAEVFFTKALEALEDLGEGNVEDLAEVTDQLAHVLWFQEKHAQSCEHFEQLLVMQEVMHGDNAVQVAQVLYDWASVCIESGDFASAERLLVQQCEILEPKVQSLQLDHAAALDALALSERERGKLAKALVHAREAVEIYQRTEGWDSLSLIEPVRNYGLILQSLADQRTSKKRECRRGQPKR